MLYLWIKLIHIVSSTLLFGTGIGTAAVMLYAYYSKNNSVIALISQYVVIADWVFTVPTIILQPLTGLWMVYIAGYSFKSLWIIGSIMGYLIALACWIPVFYLQIKMRELAVFSSRQNQELPLQYHLFFKIWFSLGWPAFFSFIVIFYFMTMKPM